MADSLTAMFDDLRPQRPMACDADRFRTWGEAMAQIIQALPRFEQRWACVALLADDLGRSMGIPMSIAFRSLAGMLLTMQDCEHLTILKA